MIPYLLGAAAAVAAVWALSSVITIVRVAVGNAHWVNGWAAFSHYLIVGVGTGLALWLSSLGLS